MVKTLCAALIVIAGSCAAAAQTAVPPEVVKDLAPTGKLRAAINLVNAVLAQKDAATGEPKGITVDLARELARRLGLPVELVIFHGAGTVFAAAKTGAWDIAFFAIEPVRAAEVDFTAPYVIIEGGYVVPADSSLKTIADVDRPGIRIAVGQGSAYDLYLTRTLKHATLVRAPAAGTAVTDRFFADKLDVVAGVKPILVAFARNHPNLRVMDGSFMEIQQAMGTPKGRDAAARYLRGFVEEMKASGFVADALKRSNQPSATVAPPASN
jgi:polar amino acid transport system substrate-binding protein